MMPTSETERILLEKLMTGRTSTLSEDEIQELRDLAVKLAKTSSRHHYIPQYYIKGFTGTDNLLSVYDKKRDTIKKERTGPNGIFFEKDRNTVEIDNIKISIIEDHFFSQIDAQLSNSIRELRSNQVNGALTLINQTMVNAFVIDLFWRLPISDSAFDDMYERSTINFQDQNGNHFTDTIREQKFKNDPAHKKMERSKMALTSFNDILSKRIPGKVFAKLWEFEHELFVVGDYPMLFNQVPGNLTDLIILDFFVPVSSKRMFACHHTEGLHFTVKEAHLFNALIIDQSTDYVCSGNMETLSNSVNYYRKLKKQNLLTPLKKRLFERTAGD